MFHRTFLFTAPHLHRLPHIWILYPIFAHFAIGNLALAGIPLTNALGEHMPYHYCLTYAFVTQQPFSIHYWNLDT